MSRAQELKKNLDAVYERIARACDTASRDASGVTLIAVTKTWPASDIEILADLGIKHVGESKEQEGHGKAETLSHLDLTWHFIGQIQRNKAKRIAEWADVIHSVDRPELIPLLGQRMVLEQINLDPAQQGRGGVQPDEALALADAIVASSLALRGVMAVAPLHGDANAAFATLERVHNEIAGRYSQASWISAGMSSDLESAIGHGATHVRLGSSILGSR